MDLVKVKFYYPNRWRQNVGDLVSIKDKRFNWFLCSKRYEDPASKLYIAEISPGTKFYDDIDGTNYILPETVKLIIVENKKDIEDISDNSMAIDSKITDLISKIKRFNYQGVVCLIDCNNPNGSIICPEVLFGFLNGVLKLDKQNSDGCPIIQYSKLNYKCIKTKIPEFPSPVEIDSVLADGFSLSIVCTVLYEYIIKYTYI
jgi:hypothetical protein